MAPVVVSLDCSTMEGALSELVGLSLIPGERLLGYAQRFARGPVLFVRSDLRAPEARQVAAELRQASASLTEHDVEVLTTVLRPKIAGTNLGRRYRGDPYALAAAEGITVKVGSQAWIDAEVGRGTPAGKQLMGRAVSAFRTAFVNSALSAYEQRETLAHEIAHILLYDCSEDQANAFMHAFIACAPLADADRRERLLALGA